MKTANLRTKSFNKKRGPYMKYNLFGSTEKINPRTKRNWKIKLRAKM